MADPAADEVRRLLRRCDEALKTAGSRGRPELAREQAAALLDRARERLLDVVDTDRQLDLAAEVSRRVGDLELLALAPALEPTPGVARAPTRGIDPRRIPPGQHLTPGWPVLHVGAVPTDPAPERWRLAGTGRVRHRTVWSLPDLRTRLPLARATTDFHCVTRWSRLDNTWEGVRVADVLALAEPRDEARFVVAAGHPAYSAEIDLAAARGDDVLLAWSHDGGPLPVAHGGPLRLVVPARYGWKSVKWVTELRLTDRDVPGYWEERGYHSVADPWREERFRDGG